ncbi:MAG: ATPase, partial [Clostridia bacterium]|nr:ATPase [Clostridia bacterium]
MIVPMKKVSLIIMGDKKQETLNKLRKLGIVQIEISEGTGEKLNALNEQITLLENAAFTVGKSKNEAQKEISTDEALSL